MLVNRTLHDRARAAAVAIAPAVLLAGAVTHPYLGNFPSRADLVDAVTADPTRWAIGHTLLGLGIALMIMFFFAVRGYLRTRGENAWSFWAVPPITIGLGLIGFMVGAEGIGGRAAVETGRVDAFFGGLEQWAIPIYLSANVLVTVGLAAFAVAVVKLGAPGGWATWIVVVGAGLQIIGLFLPTGWAAHLIAVGAIVFGWPIAYRLWFGDVRQL